MKKRINKFGDYKIPEYLRVFRTKGGQFPEYDIYIYDYRGCSFDLLSRCNNHFIKIGTLEKSSNANRDFWYVSGLKNTTLSPLDGTTEEDLINDFGVSDRCAWMQIYMYFDNNYDDDEIIKIRVNEEYSKLFDNDFYQSIADALAKDDQHRNDLIDIIRKIASNNMNEYGFKLFDILLCGHTSHQTQNRYLVDLNNRYSFFKSNNQEK